MATTSQINKAGRILRAWMNDPGWHSVDLDVAWAMQLLMDYRAAHSLPLIKATNGLRSMVKTEGCKVEVSQRLKRMSTILDKLRRQPNMALARMQDIGGCRAVLANIDELRRVERRLTRRRRPVKPPDDYIVRPRSSGYRAVHLVVDYDKRSIEVQLRTKVMHEWAVAVERLGGRINEDLKSGEGPPQVPGWLEAVADAMAIEEAGGVVDSTLMGRIERLRGEAMLFLSGGAS